MSIRSLAALLMVLVVAAASCADHTVRVLSRTGAHAGAGAAGVAGASGRAAGSAGTSGRDSAGAGGLDSAGAGGRDSTGAGASNLCDAPPCDRWGAKADGSFVNPVLWSDFGIVDVARVGSDFYLTSATHHFMGVPLLHSRDLVNWRFVARIGPELGIAERYWTPGQAYQHGVWSATLSHREGEFLLYATTPQEGVLLSSAPAPEGPWSAWQVLHAAIDWQDAAAFWDDVPGAGGDGPEGCQAYLLRGRKEGSLVQLHRMSWDGRSLLDPAGLELFTGSGYVAPRMVKHDALYYVFTAQGATSSGQQAVLRAASIEGPYEKRVILEQGSTEVNGPHIGSWVELESGEASFVHNRFAAGWGGLVHLQPAAWSSDGWPIVGSDLDGNGIGEPVARSPGPIAFDASDIALPTSSDTFQGADLGLQWMWNHEPSADASSLTARPGWLRLEALPLSSEPGVTGLGKELPFSEDDLRFARNLLVQRAMGRESSATVFLDASGMVDGQRAGLTLFGEHYAWAGVVVSGAERRVVARLIDGSHLGGPVLATDGLWLRATMHDDSTVSVAYSLEGSRFEVLGERASVVRTYYQGIKYGLFTYHLSTAPRGGTADFDVFELAHDGPSGAAEL